MTLYCYPDCSRSNVPNWCSREGSGSQILLWLVGQARENIWRWNPRRRRQEKETIRLRGRNISCCNTYCCWKCFLIYWYHALTLTQTFCDGVYWEKVRHCSCERALKRKWPQHTLCVFFLCATPRPIHSESEEAIPSESEPFSVFGPSGHLLPNIWSNSSFIMWRWRMTF